MTFEKNIINDRIRTLIGGVERFFNKTQLQMFPELSQSFR